MQYGKHSLVMHKKNDAVIFNLFLFGICAQYFILTSKLPIRFSHYVLPKLKVLAHLYSAEVFLIHAR